MNNLDTSFLIEALKEYEPAGIILFGSYAKGNQRQESDIDIAFLPQNKLSAYEVFEKQEEIASKLNVDINLIDLNATSTVFAFEILTTGKVIDITDQVKWDQFNFLTYSKYVKLNAERKEIIKGLSA